MTTQAPPNSPTPEPAMVEEQDRRAATLFYGYDDEKGLAYWGNATAHSDVERLAKAFATERHRLAAIPTDRPIAGDGEACKACGGQGINTDTLGIETQTCSGCGGSGRKGNGETEIDERGEAMVCTGCGTTRTIAAVKRGSSTAFTCCPERNMIPVRAALTSARADHGSGETFADGVAAAALNQNDAMRQELAQIGNLVSDLARAMRVDEANADGTWPNLPERIQNLTRALAQPPIGETRGAGVPLGLDVDGLCDDHGRFGCKRCVAAFEAAPETRGNGGEGLRATLERLAGKHEHLPINTVSDNETVAQLSLAIVGFQTVARAALATSSGSGS